MNSIPADAHSHAVGGEEVVPGASELTIDTDPTMGARINLVSKTQVILPSTAIGACLGCAGLTALEDVPPRVAMGSVG